MKKQLQTHSIISFLFTLTLMLASVPGIAQTAYITAAQSSVFVINVATNTVTDSVKVGHQPWGVSVSLDGRKVYIANDSDGTVSVINTATNTVSATITVGGFPSGIAVSPNGSKVYVANSVDSVIVIDTATNAVSAAIKVGHFPIGVCVSPDGSRLYVANIQDSTLSVINTATNIVLATLNVGHSPCGIAVTPDGSKVYVTNSDDDVIHVINAAADTVSAAITLYNGPYGVCITPDGSKVYIADEYEGSVSVLSTADNTVLATISIGRFVSGVSVSPDGSKVYVTDQVAAGTVTVISTASNTILTTISVGTFPVAFGNFISTHIGNSPVASFQASDRIFCANSCISFTNESTNSTSWQWLFRGATPDTSTAQNPQNICYFDSGIYSVTLIASGSGLSDTLTFSKYLTVDAQPPPPSITRHGDTLFCSSNPAYTSYQWLFNDSILSTAKDTFYVFSQGGSYNVEVRDEDGCSIAAGTNIISGINEFNANIDLSIYPNPATNQLTIHTSGFHEEGMMIEVVDVLGRSASSPTGLTPALSKGEGDGTIDVSGLAAGMYFVEMKWEGGSVARKFVKE